jgi:hypothetical protein
MSLYPLPGHEPDDEDDADLGCGHCEHVGVAHYPGGCDICDDIGRGSDCPGYAEP